MRSHRSATPQVPTTIEPQPEWATLVWRLQGPGCAACAAQREAETNALAWFLLENYRERATLNALAQSRYCVRHLTALLTQREPKLSVTLEFLVREEVTTVRGFRAALPRKRRTPWSGSTAGRRRLPRSARPADEPARCPLCEAGATAAAVAVEEVLILLGAEEGRSAYAVSDGFCGPHAWIALREVPAGSADWLAGDFEKRLERMLPALNRYVGYQRGTDRAYADTDTWVRAIRLVWGESSGRVRDATGGVEPS